MIKVGVTGGIGSGKSTVCRVFETLGIPVYNSDENAKMLMSCDPVLVIRIKELFGEEAYSGHLLNRPYIASRVFSDRDLLDRLNALVHPAVADHFRWWVKAQCAPYVIEEAAVLFESGAYETMDRIVAVVAPEALRIKRAVLRDGVSAESVAERVRCQMSQDEIISQSDFVIDCGETRLVVPQILKIHQALCEL